MTGFTIRTAAGAALAAGLALSAPAAAQSLSDCDWRASAWLLAEPWEANSRTFANGDVRIALIDAIEQAGTDPCDVAPDHWRHMHNRLAAGMEPSGYLQDRHRAWLRRRKVQP